MSKRIFTVLCIDGGGVRGVVPARILQHIEETTGKPIAELFDLVAGNSTGSILAGSLTSRHPHNPRKPKLSAKDMLKIYMDESKNIFPNIRYRQLRHLMPGTNGFYDPLPFEKMLKDKMGDAKMGDALTHLMIPGTEIKKFKPIWMHHFKGENNKSKWDNVLLRDAVRASSTAPTIFPSKYIYSNPNPNAPQVQERHAFIDGTFFSGTMTRRTHTAAKKLAPKGAEIIVVNLGTGYTISSYTPEEYNKLSPLDLVTSSTDGPSILSLSLSMFSTDVNTDLKDELGDNFFCFDAPLNDGSETSMHEAIDDSSPEYIAALLKFAEDKILKPNMGEFDRLCQILKNKPRINALYQNSEKSFDFLSKHLNDATSLQQLDKRYYKIIKYSCDLNRDGLKAKILNKDVIYRKSHHLLEDHKAELDNLYRNLSVTLYLKKHKNPSRIKSFFNSMTKPFKKSNSPTDLKSCNTSANDNLAHLEAPATKTPPRTKPQSFQDNTTHVKASDLFNKTNESPKKTPRNTDKSHGERIKNTKNTPKI